MSGKANALDLGSRTARFLQLEDGKRGLRVTGFAAGPVDDAASILGGQKLGACTVGLSGRAMTLRYSQVPPSPDWQLQNLMGLEIEDLSQQTGGKLSADYNLLPVEDDASGTDTILLAFARDEALEEQGMESASFGASVAGHVPRCVALFNAFVRCGDSDPDATVGLVDVGHETIDLAICRGTDLLFVRNLSQGAKVFDDAIAAGFGVGERKSEQLKRELLDLDPASRGKYASGQAEKVTVAAGGAGSMIASAIQSSLAFCKNQIGDPTLQLDKVLVSGGGSRIRGLRGMLREALRVPVDVFDPFDTVDLSALDGAEHEALETFRAEAVVALGLAITACDDETYQLRILPEKLRKKQRFVQRTIFNIGAGVVAGALLAMTAVEGMDATEKAETASQRMRRQVSKVKRISDEATEEIELRNQLAVQVRALAAQSVPRDGLLRVMDGLWKVKPAEVWVEEVRVATRALESRRSESEPVVIIEGRGKDLSGAGVPYGKFLGDFKGLGFEVIAKTSGSDSDAMQFEWTVRFPADEPVTEEEGD